MKIECTGVSYRYDVPGDEWAIRDISLDITQGEKIAVIGPAGSGKTTLIQLLDALIMPTTGDVLFDGKSIRDLSREKQLPSIRRRIGVLFQFPEHQFFHESAYDELTFALKNFNSLEALEIEERARAMMKRFHLDIEKLKGLSPFNLSSGEKRKLALASALMTSPEVLILDEPTAGMDASGRKELIKIISSFTDTTVILVTHNQEDFLRIVDRVIGISKGEKVIDAHRDKLVDHLARLDEAGIIPPLVLRVQHWLKVSGFRPENRYFDMDDLITFLKREISIKR
jgi:energy-coupling factor transport system ATP-binding protein